MKYKEPFSILRFLLEKLGIGRIKIVTDSKYVKEGIETWIFNWMNNGWKNANGLPVANKKNWEELLLLTKGSNIIWVSVYRKITN